MWIWIGLLCLASAVAGQTFTLGVSADPCIGGGLPYDVRVTTPTPAIPTLRYSSSSFACTFTGATGPGSYVLRLEFVEPNVTSPGARIFNVWANDAPILSGLDLYALGGTAVDKIVTRSALVFTPDGKITVRLATVIRSAVLSRVTLSSYSVVTAIELFQIDCAKGQYCTGNVPAASLTLAHMPESTATECFTVFRNGVKNYLVNKDFFVNANLLSLKLADGDIVEVVYLYKPPPKT